MERQDALRVFENDYGYIVINESLTEVKFLHTDFDLGRTEEETKTAFYTSQTVALLPNGKEVTIDDYSNVFDTKECYERNIPAETAYKTLDKERYSSVLSDIWRGTGARTRNYWVFENGEAVMKTLQLRHFQYNYGINLFESDEIPTDCEVYDDREQCLSYNSYRVVDREGKETIRVGINKLLELDDDQKEWVGILENAIRELRDRGVEIFADTCDDYRVYNFRHVEDYAFSYDLDADGKDAELYEEARRYGKPFKLDIGIEQWGDDQSLFIKRK